MTADKRFKRLVRDRMTATGESYASARRHLLLHRSGGAMTDSTTTTDHYRPPTGTVSLTVTGVRQGRIGVGQFAAAVGLAHGDDWFQHHVVSAEAGDVIAAALAGEPTSVRPDVLWRAEREEGRLRSVTITVDPPTGHIGAEAEIERGDGTTFRLGCSVDDALIAAVVADPAPTVHGPGPLLVRYDRPVGSDSSCPECGATVSQAITRGPLPANRSEPGWSNAIASGLLVYEPDDSLPEPVNLRQCPLGHRYENGVPRRPWLPPRDDDPRPT